MIKIVIIIIYYIFFIITLLYSIWFVTTGIIGLIKKNKNKLKDYENENFFAILIPARNEEKVIKNLIQSLKEQNYSKSKYKIYTVINNCTDNTEKIAASSGADIIKCDVPTKTKANVLNYAFEKLKDKEFDAYIVFDADNVVHADFIKEMNKVLNNGYKVSQGYRDAKNPKDTWISGSYTLFYLIQNIFFNESRMAFNSSSSINGTGFMIKKELIDKYGFETYSLTEDVEYTGLCAFRNERIYFAENAITYDEYPTNSKVSWIQRRRWSSGIIECMKLYSFKLFKSFIKTKNMSELDMSLIYLGPLIQVIAFFCSVTLLIFNILKIRLYDPFSYLFSTNILFFIITFIIGIIIELFALKYKHKKIKEMIVGIFTFPIFLITWIPINISCLVKKEKNWVAIKHDRSISLSEIKNPQNK